MQEARNKQRRKKKREGKKSREDEGEEGEREERRERRCWGSWPDARGTWLWLVESVLFSFIHNTIVDFAVN